MSAPDKYLIVGQGLAGSVLIHQLAKNNIPFDVIDNNHEYSASLAAGGIMHPMSFKRLSLAWRALELIEVAVPFYENLQSELNENFFQTSIFHRPFISIEEQNNWMARMNEHPYNEILGISDEPINGVNSPYGIGLVKLCGRLEVQSFISATRSFFQTAITSDKFEFSKLNHNGNCWQYSNQPYKGVIFCEGFQYIYNPYFNYLPDNLTKGEIIEITTKAFEQKMVSRGCFIVPQEQKDNYLVGSTYRWKTTSSEITEDAKNELSEKIEKTTNLPFEIYHQAAGIRPTIPDRKPLIGEHPKHKGLFMFNGMGSKTVKMAPLFADQFISYLKGENELFPEVNLQRFTKKHFHKFEDYEADQMS